MEASEAVRRIFWRHRWLLLILTILPAAVVIPLREHQPVTYAATATIQGQGMTPDVATQVQAIQSRVTAVATSPALVRSVINQAKVNRNATQLAKHEISVTPLGSSAIMALTVTDRSSPVAVALAGSLAHAVVNELNQLGINDNPQLAALSKTSAQLAARRNELLRELGAANASNAATSVQVQSLLSQLAAVEQELSTNQTEAQQVLATVTTETGASVVSVPTSATAASRHVVADGALAALLGLVLGLLIAAVREVIRPTVAQSGAGARELGAVLLGNSDARGGQIVGLDQDLPERLNLAAHRAGVLTIVLTGPGSQDRLAALAARLRDELPTAERADARSAQAWAAVPIDHGYVGDDPAPNGDGRRPTVADGGRRQAGLATERPTDLAAARHSRPQQPQRTVVTLDDIRLGAPPPDAALVVVLPRFAPHGALDQAADLGVTADWPILGVIGIRHRSWLASMVTQAAARPGTRGPGSRPPGPPVPDPREAETMPFNMPNDMQMEGEDD